MQGVEAQVRELQQQLTSATVVVNKLPSSTVLQLEHPATLSTGESCCLQLTIALPSTYPQAPPRVTTLNGMVTVPYTATDDNDDDESSSGGSDGRKSNYAAPGRGDVISSRTDAASGGDGDDDASLVFAALSRQHEAAGDASAASAAAAAAWRASRLSLVDVVRNAVAHLVRWWGVVRPPDVASTRQQLRGETDQLLRDLIANPNCLDAYCYQIPTMKHMRDVATRTVQQVEATALTNERLQGEVEELRGQVRQLQTSLQQQVNALKPLNDNRLLNSVASPQALLRTLEADVHTLSEECKQDGKSVLALHATDRRAFQESLDAYRAKSARMHLLELKRSIYKAQLSH